MFLTYRAESALRRHDAATAADNARAALDTALDTGAPRCVDLVATFIGRLDKRPEQPIVDLRDYARHRLA
ncbi:hypothetical protein GCM10010289_74900 [Streptomyces violascens]|nr:hypothetical protein GCM10010289_74900 [Streptomyces violascens]